MDRDDLDWAAAAAREVAQEAAELGATARQEIPAFPWVIVGEVDGRAFYVRERSEIYEVVVAPDAAPTGNPWPAETAEGITVAAGVSDDFREGDRQSPARAVRVAVAAVRTWLRQRACEHDQRPDGR
ncbi:hypothetical protein DDP54_07795 [Cellulomonas sp. WB94]|uniref:hypothetical protein n=1 Tax=Cellulomonas sp. WB94 TaxID=2173174 RepID=UPI000D584795|nr:hypothetical protein [Cellulomonas sp. WB94]PVU82922.1 hypothetical protein DDP54_07795 [Cellulomonas sp. WB94]